MRKRQKRKLRSCPMCKPGKTGGANRWTPKEFQKLKEWEKQLQELKRN